MQVKHEKTTAIRIQWELEDWRNQLGWFPRKLYYHFDSFLIMQIKRNKFTQHLSGIKIQTFVDSFGFKEIFLFFFKIQKVSFNFQLDFQYIFNEFQVMFWYYLSKIQTWNETVSLRYTETCQNAGFGFCHKVNLTWFTFWIEF